MSDFEKDEEISKQNSEEKATDEKKSIDETVEDSAGENDIIPDGEVNPEQESDEVNSREENSEDNSEETHDGLFVEEEITVSPKKANVFIASLILKIHNTDRKKLLKILLSSTLLIVFAVLVFTDIIPILPNAYHRSYVGKSFILGETQNSQYDKIGDNVVYAAPGQIYIFGPDMSVEAKAETYAGAPVLRTNSENGIVYFKNTAEYGFINKKNISMRKVEGNIISAYVSSGGYYSIVSNAGAGHNMCVTVYNSSGKYIYEWFTNYNVVDSVVSSSGKYMVASVIEINDSKIESKLIYFDLGKTDPVKEMTIESNLVFELYSTGTDKFIAIGDKRTDSYTYSGEKIWSVDYSSKNLKTYDISDEGVIAYVFDRYNSSLSESTVEIYSMNGKCTGTYTSKTNIRNVSVNNDYCLLTLADSTVLVNNECEIKKTKNLNGNFSNVILYENYNFGFMIHDGESEIVSVKH